jgi:hypothetical protein
MGTVIRLAVTVHHGAGCRKMSPHKNASPIPKGEEQCGVPCLRTEVAYGGFVAQLIIGFRNLAASADIGLG